MAEDVNDVKDVKDVKDEKPQQRLCSEIQLFDLCSEEVCKHRDGRYCTNSEALAKFEAISEEDSSDMYVAEEMDDIDGDDDLSYDDEAAGDEYVDEESDEDY